MKYTKNAARNTMIEQAIRNTLQLLIIRYPLKNWKFISNGIKKYATTVQIIIITILLLLLFLENGGEGFFNNVQPSTCPDFATSRGHRRKKTIIYYIIRLPIRRILLFAYRFCFLFILTSFVVPRTRF